MRRASFLLAATILPVATLAAQSDQAGKLAKPLVSLEAPREVSLNYTGSGKAVQAMLGGGITPLSLESADFNADGAPDVVAGYATKDGGVLTVLLGNPDAFAPADPGLYGKAMRGEVPATFLPKAAAYILPEAPDLLATGDFNRDGRQDVLVAARGGNLYLLAGDGHGGLLAAQQVTLPGRVQALAATGDGHVAVSLNGDQGSEVRVLAPTASGLRAVATYPLPAQGDALSWGTLGGGTDLAVVAGSRIMIVYSALTAKPLTESIVLPSKAVGLAIGNFIWDRDGRAEISVLGEDGSISILQHGALDTRPVTPADIPGRRASVMAKNRPLPDPTSLGPWTIAKKLPHAGSANASPVANSAFNSPRLAASEAEDLMVLDGQRSQLSILDTSGKLDRKSAEVAFPAAPVAALALPRKINSSRDVAVLVAGRATPMLLTEDGDPVFNVTATADEDDANACNNSSITSGAGPDGQLSLREAVCEVNNSGAGTYTISVPAGTYSLTGIETGELYVGVTSGQTINIVGAGASTTIIRQTDGIDRIFEADPNVVGNIPVSVSNVTISGGNCSHDDGTQTPPGDCSLGGGAILAGGIGGDNLTLTNTVFSNNTDPDVSGGGNTGGAVVLGGPALTITSSTFSNNSAPQGEGGAIWFGNEGASAEGNLTITNSIFTGNTVTAAQFADGGAIFATPAAGFSVNVTGSTFTGNQAEGSSGEGGGIYVVGSSTVSNSRFSGNTAASGSGFLEYNGVATVVDNWWGCNAGPGGTGCDTVGTLFSSTATFAPWLVLSLGASPSQVYVDGISTLAASITTNSNGVSGFSVPNETPVTFAATLGTVNPVDNTFSSGQATSTFTAGSATGGASASATVDNQTVTTNLTVLSPVALAVTVTSVGTFTQGSTAEWDLTVFNEASAGSTSGTVNVQDTLPSGYTLNSYSGAGWTCSGTTTINCTSTSAVAGGSSYPKIMLTVNVPANSPVSVTDQALTWGGGDPNHTNLSNAATGFETVPVVQTPAAVAATSGSGQTAIVGTAFSAPLIATVTDAGGVPVPGVTVVFTASNLAASGSFSGGHNTISAVTNSSGVASSGTLTATFVAGSFNVTASVAGIAGTATFALTNVAGAATHFTVVAPPTAISGQSFEVTLSALDAFNNIATGYAGTIDFTSSDPLATLPSPATLPGGLGTASITLATPGTQTITATDSVTTSITGTSGGIAVSAPQLVVTSNQDAGVGTLRYALQESASFGAANISFSSATFNSSNTPSENTITLSSGPLNLPPNTTITGPTSGSGATLTNLVTVSGNGASTVFTETSGVTGVFLNSLNIVNGLATNGGGILNNGTLTVTGSAVSNNSATYGGGIYNGGTLTVSNSTISGNSATSEGGGILTQAPSGALTLTNVTISRNQASAGGGIIDLSGAATIVNSSISGNSASGNGGGIASQGSLTLANDIISGNAGGDTNFVVAPTNNGGNVIGSASISLAPLGSYGGALQTLLPLPGSPALCAGLSSNAATAGVTTDERGFPFDPHCPAGSVDAGAVQANYQSIQFTGTTFTGNAGIAFSPAPVVTVTESGQNIGGVPVTLAYAGPGTASGLGPVTTAAGTGATFPLVEVTKSGTGTLSATLQVTPGYAITTSPNATLNIGPLLLHQGIHFLLPLSTRWGVPATNLSTLGQASSGLPVTFTILSGPATLNGTVVSATGLGPVVIQATQPGNAVYAPAAPVTQTITIVPGVLTVVPNPASMVYGGVVPTASYTIRGFAYNDTIAVVSGSPVITTTATSTSPVGTYIFSITPGTLSATNYIFEVIPGVLTINKANLAVTATNLTMHQGSPVPTLTYNITGFVNNETQSSATTGAPTLTTTATSSSKPGTYPIRISVGSLSASNYSFHPVNGTLTVLP